MPVAEAARPAARPRAGRRVPAWPLAIAALLAGAVALRVWGVQHGLPYVFNADENAHFVPRAIGMFGHTYNPGYFVNPPAFTYLLHVAFWVRWGGREAVGDAFAADPTAAFTIARVLAGVLGAAAAGLLVWAGARLFDRRVGLLAGALLAVAFLPVHYGHLALNDVPALAPLCLSLVGAAGVYRHGRLRDYALAGGALGVACAVKYTSGIVLLCLLAAAAVGPGRRLSGLALAAVLALAGFLVANPYALFDWETFRAGLEKQSETSADGGGKLGLVGESGVLYYLGTTTWGLGWVPAVAAAGGAVWLAARRWPLALILVPAPVVFLLFMGMQDRFFARWLLPVYPMLALLAAWVVVEVAGRRRWALALGAVALCAQGLVFSIHNDTVLARDDTRELAREWMVEHIPAGTKIVVEPIAPHQWAWDPEGPNDATGSGARWNKWPTSKSRGRVVKLEDYERTLRPGLLGSYVRGGYCWLVRGSTQYGRALVEPEEVPGAIAYYEALRGRGERVYRVSPLSGGEPVDDFSFDFSFNAYPLSYARPGPEIQIYRLCDPPTR
ncbi:MAG: ArnT family glycosyltransferase [Solirubrobacteraceae bacterium]